MKIEGVRYYGICSSSEMARIESGEKISNPFLLDRLLERLGKSSDHLEHVLSLEDYSYYELQVRIKAAIREKDFKKASEYLKNYASQKYAKKPIHKQFR